MTEKGGINFKHDVRTFAIRCLDILVVVDFNSLVGTPFGTLAVGLLVRRVAGNDWVVVCGSLEAISFIV